MEGEPVKVFKTVSKAFQAIGVWPKISHEKDKFYKFKVNLVFLLSSLIPAGSIYHLIYNLYNNYKLTTRELLEDTSVILRTAIIDVVFMTMVFKYSQILEIMRLIGCYSKFGKPPKADDLSNRLSSRVKIFNVIIWMSGAGYVFVNAFREEQTCINLREINKSANVCGLITNMWLPFNIDYYPVKQIVLFIQFIGAGLFYNATGGYLFFLGVICNMLSTKIEHLMEMVSKCFDAESKDEKHNNLVVCVLYHLHIRSIINKINECFGTMLLFIATTFAIVVSILGFSVLQYHSMKDAIYLGAFIIVVIMIYGNGQILLDKSEELSEAIYNTSWYEQDAQSQKEILFLLMHSQRLVAVYADVFGEISRKSLATFLQTAYSYMALLNSSM